MFDRKGAPLAPARSHDPIAVLRHMMTSIERAFDDWPASTGLVAAADTSEWSPKVDVMERDRRLVTRIDLPGIKKEDVSVEVTDGRLVVSGERKRESDETKGSVYRLEREYGSFYRAVPLPEGCKIEDVRATFSGGVLEVSVPLPARAVPDVHKVAIEEATPAPKNAA